MNLELHQVTALAAVLAAAQADGMIAALAEAPRSQAELAQRCGVDPLACAHVLDVFEAFGLATREGDRYVAGAELGGMARRPWMARFELTLWQHTPAFLRTGAPLMAMDATPAEREHIYHEVVADLGTLFGPAADHLAERCGVTPRAILDLGCGSGVWSLALARRQPEAHVTGLDLPAVLEQFRTRAASLGVSDRVSTIEGDVFTVPIPAGRWDLAIIANVLRLEPLERARALVGRAVEALRPGGSLLIVDALAAGTAAAERGRAIYALHLAMRTQSGRVHPAREIRQWMEEAGCEAPREIVFDEREVSAGALGALIARKRAI